MHDWLHSDTPSAQTEAFRAEPDLEDKQRCVLEAGNPSMQSVNELCD
uniref:Uncharacterized protein n=1 Tax=Rubinisphaera brasiliensis (strain ATCC 49424 / DSM 5305 / JCM 21570 / IAM 15109 / NBRC 103401 / IFAM 1448) TaxID=756272 RepID=F0SLG0_RUBBR|nr:hypothetical protein Plabr_4495 [Rubinisphaera brasiliensis DSM 5305]